MHCIIVPSVLEVLIQSASDLKVPIIADRNVTEIK